MKICKENRWYRITYRRGKEFNFIRYFSLEFRVLYRKSFFGIKYGKLREKWRIAEIKLLDFDDEDIEKSLWDLRKNKKKIRYIDKYPCELLK